MLTVCVTSKITATTATQADVEKGTSPLFHISTFLTLAKKNYTFLKKSCPIIRKPPNFYYIFVASMRTGKRTLLKGKKISP